MTSNRSLFLLLFVTLFVQLSISETGGNDFYYEYDENEVYDNDAAVDDRSGVGDASAVEEVAEERFFGVNSVFSYLANPSNEAFFIIRMFFQWISLMGGFAVIHFSTWDYSDTRPGEEVNFIRLFNFFANPETPLLVTTILMGHAIVASALFYIPALFWPGAPLPVKPTKVNIARSADSCSTKRSTSAIQEVFPLSLRSILSPDGMSRTMIAMSMEHAGFMLFWLLSPFFTGSAFSSTTTTTAKSARCIREAAELPAANVTDSFILRSINTDPDQLEDTSPRFQYPNLDPY